MNYFNNTELILDSGLETALCKIRQNVSNKEGFDPTSAQLSHSFPSPFLALLINKIIYA